MKTTGGCFCGAIEYVAEINENQVVACHCKDCQIMSSSAFRVLVPLELATLEWTRGRPRTFDKVAESGNVRRQAFCADCGTHIATLPPDSEAGSGFGALRVMTSRDAAALVPKFEMWCSSRLPWLPAFDTERKFDRQP